MVYRPPIRYQTKQSTWSSRSVYIDTVTLKKKYNVNRNIELKMNEAEACLSTAQLMIKKRTPQALNAEEACFTEVADKVKKLRPLLATLCHITSNFTFTLCYLYIVSILLVCFNAYELQGE